MPENEDETKVQQMIDELVKKAKKASEEYLKLDQETVDNITKAMCKSADILVVGSYITMSDNYEERLASML